MNKLFYGVMAGYSKRRKKFMRILINMFVGLQKKKNMDWFIKSFIKGFDSTFIILVPA